jgi:hypothetical protein
VLLGERMSSISKKTWAMRWKYLESEKYLGEFINMDTWSEWERWLTGAIYMLESRYDVKRAVCVAEDKYLCEIYKYLTDAKKYNIEQSVQAFIDRILHALSIAKQHNISLPEIPQSLIQFLKAMVPGFEV